MTVKSLMDALELTCLAGAEGFERKVTGCYIGDLLSWVMGRAASGSAWITVMGNVNAVAVAVLADVACVILCEGSHLDEAAKIQADQNDIPVLSSELDAYQTALALSRLLEQQAGRV